MPASKLPLHPRFRAPQIPKPGPAGGERVHEIQQLIELVGIAFVAAAPPAQRTALRAHLQELGNVAWSKSLPSAAKVLRDLAEAVPASGDEPPPF